MEGFLEDVIGDWAYLDGMKQKGVSLEPSKKKMLPLWL